MSYFCSMSYMYYHFIPSLAFISNVTEQDLEKEELPPHMTRVSAEEIKRVSSIFDVLLLAHAFT